MKPTSITEIKNMDDAFAFSKWLVKEAKLSESHFNFDKEINEHASMWNGCPDEWFNWHEYACNENLSPDEYSYLSDKYWKLISSSPKVIWNNIVSLNEKGIDYLRNKCSLEEDDIFLIEELLSQASYEPRDYISEINKDVNFNDLLIQLYEDQSNSIEDKYNLSELMHEECIKAATDDFNEMMNDYQAWNNID